MSWLKRLAAGQGSTTKASEAPFAPPGGLALPRNKPGLPSIGALIPEIALPEQLVLPLLDYHKRIVDARVSVGNRVRLGDVLADGVLASASGNVRAIESRAIIHPSHRCVPCIVLDVDTHASQNQQTLAPMDTLDVERIERAGISGLGGAGFGTANKLRAASRQGASIHTLLVNAVECEPQISCDESLIRSDAASVVTAIVAMMNLTRCTQCIIAVEDDKQEAIDELRKQLASQLPASGQQTRVQLKTLSAIYPSGAEKVLIQRITGERLSSGTRASDKGVLCLNVATIVAAFRARAGFPLVSRIVTIAGEKTQSETNVRVRFGTSVAHVLKHTGNLPDINCIDTSRIRAGGPLSGFDLIDPDVPVTATTNCIAVEAAYQKTQTSACIRCAMCSDVCPVNLLPQQLYWHAASDDINGAYRFDLDSCIECGCCDVVCPSAIPLTSTFRYARSVWREQQQQQTAAQLARERFEQRKIRLHERELDAQRVREQKKAQLASADDAIAAALARSRARKKKS